MGKAIEIRSLTKNYGKNRGINEVSFEVERGDVFGFLGPNGAGKSTTIRCLLGLIKSDGGSAEILGLDTVKNRKDILRKIGYMPSESMFYPSMKVSEVIKFAANMRKTDCSKEAAMLCERLKVDTKKRIDELSLGNRKKVSIVCAMQHKPELFIFDEPTSGLDPLMQAEFFSLILEYNQQGATCLLSSHVLSEIRRYCNKAAIIRDGRLVCADSIEKLSHTNAKHVKITGVSDLPLDSMSNVEHTEDGLEFVYSGSINELLSVLRGINIKDISIEEPSLEEIFMHYYDKE